jgi:hypothetical protein
MDIKMVNGSVKVVVFNANRVQENVTVEFPVVATQASLWDWKAMDWKNLWQELHDQVEDLLSKEPMKLVNGKQSYCVVDFNFEEGTKYNPSETVVVVYAKPIPEDHPDVQRHFPSGFSSIVYKGPSRQEFFQWVKYIEEDVNDIEFLV